MMSAPGQGIVALRCSHAFSSPGPLGVAEQIDVSRAAENHRHEHVSRLTTVNITQPLPRLTVEGLIVCYRG